LCLKQWTIKYENGAPDRVVLTITGVEMAFTMEEIPFTYLLLFTFDLDIMDL
jgi:hypothetical protein